MCSKVIFISGASSGIGFDTAIKLARQGHIVYGAARRTDKLKALEKEGIKTLHLDVTDSDSCRSAIDTVIKEQGRVDVLVNNAGYGSLGAIENVSMEEARKQIDVNLFGLAELTRLVLPQMREQGGGKIINISSVAGRMVINFGAWYNVSKYAVEAFSDALRIEAKPFGIDVVLIEPGGIGTDWGFIAADHLEQSSRGSVYEQSAQNMADTFRKAYGAPWMSSPSVVSKAIVKAINAKRPRTRYLVGLGARSIVFFHAILPTRWWDAMMRSFSKIRL